MHRSLLLKPRNTATLLRRSNLPLYAHSMRPIRSATPTATLHISSNLTQAATRTATQRVQALNRWLTAGSGKLSMSTLHGTAASTEEQHADVIQRKLLGSRTLILNRPLRFNALTLSMVRSMTPQLQAWDKSDLAKVIIIKGTGHRAFCAGGDVRTVIEQAKLRNPEALEFFEEEYQLNYLIATLDTPFVAIMNGITMGGGVGLSVHAPFRIATENTVFAMPEAAIGFFPDVGGSFFLSRMDGEVGTYLALTGNKLTGLDVFYAGIATHYVPSLRLQALEDRLSELETSDHEVINAAIEDFVGEFNPNNYSLRGDTRQTIDRCFRFDSVDEIIEALGKEETYWAKTTTDTLLKMSPTSLKVTLQQLRKGKQLGIADCFKMEFNLVQKFLVTHDFAEGVTASLIEKRMNPVWEPPTLAELRDADIQNFYFATSSPNQLVLPNKNFKQYPHRRFALPSEEDVASVVKGETEGVGDYAMTKDEVVNWFSRERNGKQGVREKVAEVLERMTVATGKGEGEGVKWKY
ncbi:ClpP/crotonase-like domain-containing protein [Endogone sp. FLAS-F59071]|nr:ClpP/crotonase-like domain-containing protein [Endogone sp. FLAS-F59071]|eukprot:RUS22253.1 ClpP/crotonase-like domain-containing protein [Endogone sp. FLAS-F59071]